MPPVFQLGFQVSLSPAPPPFSFPLGPSQSWVAALGCLFPQLSGLGGFPRGILEVGVPSSTSGSSSSDHLLLSLPGAEVLGG